MLITIVPQNDNVRNFTMHNNNCLNLQILYDCCSKDYDSKVLSETKYSIM